MSSDERLHALDSLRAVAMLLGVVLHAAIPFLTVRAPWIAHDTQTGASFDILVGFIHGFRMQVFFFIAGFFAHVVWQKSGTRGFIKQRGVRIGVPFLAGMLTIIPLAIALFFWAETIHGPNPDVPREAEPSLLSYPTMHLWFLEFLLAYYVGAILVALCRYHPAGIKLAARLDAAFDWLMRQPLKPLMLALPLLPCLWNGPAFGEVDAAGAKLFPAPRALAYFAFFFSLGWWLHRRLSQLAELRRWLKSYLLLALFAFLAWGTGLAMKVTPADPNYVVVKVLTLYATAVYAWSMTFAVTGLFLVFASRHSARMRYLADASYWIYLWHLPVVLWLQVLVVKLQLNPWLKLGLMLLVTMALLLPSYHYLVRYTWVGRLLNGPRSRQPVALS